MATGDIVYLVRSTEDARRPILGLYVDTEEDVVIYRDASGGERYAKADCVDISPFVEGEPPTDEDRAAQYAPSRFSADELKHLHETLTALRDEIDQSPDRFESNVNGELASMDWDVVMLAMRVVHRLMLWREFPAQHDDAYLRPYAGGGV